MIYLVFIGVLALCFLLGFTLGVIFPQGKNKRILIKSKKINSINRELRNFLNYDGTPLP